MNKRQKNKREKQIQKKTVLLVKYRKIHIINNIHVSIKNRKSRNKKVKNSLRKEL